MSAQAAKTTHSDPISLAVGEPEGPPPPQVAAAVDRAIRDGQTTYGPIAGLPELREALANDRGLDSPESVVVTPGGKPALAMALRTILDPGDEVLLVSPYWPSFRDQVLWSRGVPVVLDGHDDESFERAVTDRTRVVVLNSPNNPTSQILACERVEAWVERARRHDLWILSDEVYRDLAFDHDCPSPSHVGGGEGRARTIVVTSFSKRFAMTGYRLGALFGPSSIVTAVTSWMSSFVTHASTPVQFGGRAALEHGQEWAETRRLRYREVARELESELSELDGVLCPAPDAGFYLWLSVATGLEARGFSSAAEFAGELLRHAGVRVVPGEAFGAPGFVRLAYALPESRRSEAIDRLKRFWSASRTS